ncbi:hypothetical protein Btru_026869 [Bulinus truncatus]|nr:hypothetical protein Btru_026869 [Bulinus truncatus]
MSPAVFSDTWCLNVILLIILSIKIFPEAAFDCAMGLWGSQCTNNCGNCEGGKAFCQVTDGLCYNGCARGFSGRDCKTPCPAGTHGQYCYAKCGFCSDVRPICDPVSGMCPVGCKPGYQRPHCKLECPPYTWGDECNSTCTCRDPPVECSCHPETGQCEPCAAGGKSKRFSITVEKPGCLNQYALDDAIQQYKPPNVLDIPWVPVVLMFCLIFLFVVTYYIYWWIYVRQAPEDQETVEIKREKKRQRMRKKQLKFYGKYAKENMAKYWMADWENKEERERESYEQVYF